MKTEIKALWVNALRSGEYEQTTEVLHRVGGGYCCLGVLCDLAYKAGVVHRNANDEGIYEYDNVETMLPYEVLNWSGLRDSDPEVEWTYEPDGEPFTDDFKLSNLNDEFHLTFDEIAELIEEQL